MPSGLPKGDAGWLHYVGPGEVKPTPFKPKPKVYLTPEQVGRYLHTAMCQPDDDLFGKLSQILRLSPQSVWAMHGGYDIQFAVLTFPMFGADGRPVGVRFRRRDGKKWSLRGGREGIFQSRQWRPDVPQFIAEGPTDAAALVEAGFPAVLGRPNCSGGVQIIKDRLASHPRTPVVVLADPDEPGVAGAERLAIALPNPTIILSGVLDIRDFVTKFRRRADARHAILKVLAGYSRDDWRTVGCNLAGKLFNFSTLGAQA